MLELGNVAKLEPRGVVFRLDFKLGALQSGSWICVFAYLCMRACVMYHNNSAVRVPSQNRLPAPPLFKCSSPQHSMVATLCSSYFHCWTKLHVFFFSSTFSSPLNHITSTTHGYGGHGHGGHGHGGH